MKRLLSRVLILGSIIIVGLGFFVADTFAEGEEIPGTSIRITPVSKILQLSSGITYDDNFEVFNDGSASTKIKVYAAPYSYVYSDVDDTYRLGFANENNFTQLSRWISFKNSDGNYVEKATFNIDPGASSNIEFKVTTPDNIPAGGQYAMIFAHTISEEVNSNGIRTEVSPGIVIYGRSNEGEVISTAEISDIKIESDHFTASVKVKNTGNIDFTAIGKLKVEPIIGFASYETEQNAGLLSVIPEAELVLSEKWEGAPSFGIYKASWTVMAGDVTETVDRVVFLFPVWFIILAISLLTFLIIWIIIGVRRRKERRSRLAI